jgi:MFS family permease
MEEDGLKEKVLNNKKEEYKSLILKAKDEGIYQKYILYILLAASFFSSVTIAALPLHKELPEYFCFNRQDFEDEPMYLKYKKEPQYKIFHNEHCIKKFCSNQADFINEHLSVLVADYSTIDNFTTELNLLCDQEEFFNRFTQWLFIGRIGGMLIFSYVSDKVGRYQTYFIQLYILLACFIMYFLFKNETLILFIGLLSNACMYLWNHVCLICTETMSDKMYSLGNAMISVAFSFSGLYNIIIMYFFGSWNLLLITYIIIVIVTIIFSKKYITETPIYLIEMERYEEARKVIKKISEVNNSEEEHLKLLFALKSIKRNYNDKSLDMSIQNQNDFGMTENNKPVSEQISLRSIITSVLGPYLLIVKSPKNTLNVLKTAIFFTTAIFIYYGQLFYIEQLPGNIYLNSALIFIAEAIAEAGSGFILQRFDKRQIIACVFLMTGLSCSFIALFENDFFKIILIFIITLSISIGFVAISVFNAEIFEVNVKATSVSLLSNFSSIFMIWSPYVIYLFGGNAYLAFAVLCFISLGNILFIKGNPNASKTFKH